MHSEGGRTFHHLDFNPAYRVEIDPEFPSDGDWRCPVFGFGSDGQVQREVISRWGAPLVVHVMPTFSPEWIGVFPAGGLGGARGVFAGPAPTQMCAVVAGQAYLVRVDVPGSDAVMAHDEVNQAVPVSGASLLLLAGYTDIVAIGPDGVKWRTQRLAADGLRITEASADAIYCTIDALDGSLASIIVDPASGKVRAGPLL
ncbi:MAG: hypothetical protein DLM55_11920 [Acidimicrobiales bacterium]|nr:MAG: hypothetical protein DLM55_11920 [Acidimicrobiales bacterium]